MIWWASPSSVLCHSNELWTSAPWWACVFPSLPFICPPHCIVYVTSDMKEAHDWLQDLGEARMCFLASMKLSGEFNSPACALPFFWHSVGSRDAFLTWDSHIERLHIKASLFKKAKILRAHFSPSNSHGDFNHLCLYIEYCVSQRQIQDCYWGLGATEMERTRKCLGEKSKESRRPAE